MLLAMPSCSGELTSIAQTCKAITATFTGPPQTSLFPKNAEPAAPCATYCYHGILATCLMLAPEFSHSVPVGDIVHYQTSQVKSVLGACHERIEHVMLRCEHVTSLLLAQRTCQLARRICHERFECVVRATSMSRPD